MLEDKVLTDSTGAKIAIKRGKTAQQRDRNTKLQKAESEMKKCAPGKSETVKINWKDRTVEYDGKACFRQNRNDNFVNFAEPFTQVEF